MGARSRTSLIPRTRSPTGSSGSSSRACGAPRSSARGGSAPKAWPPTIVFCARCRCWKRACPLRPESPYLCCRRRSDFEPDYAPAHAHLAWRYEWCFTRGRLAEGDKSAALLHARTVIASNTDDATALAVAGIVIFFLAREHEMAQGAIDRALALNASCATALYLGAMANANVDRPARAKLFAERALRLSPFDTSGFEAHLALGIVAVGGVALRRGGGVFCKAFTDQSALHTAYFLHAITLALAGRAEETRVWVERGLALEPGFRVRMFFAVGIATGARTIQRYRQYNRPIDGTSKMSHPIGA